MELRLALVFAAATLSSTACSGAPSAGPPRTAAVAGDDGAEAATLEVVARLERGPGNLTVSPDGRLFVSLHPFYEAPYPVAEVREHGGLVQVAAAAGLDAVLGLQVDPTGVLWLLDTGMKSGAPRRLVGWDLATEAVVADIDLGAATPEDAFVNDLAVDAAHRHAYVADPAGGGDAALVVVDLEGGTARRVLEGTPFVVPDPTLDLVIDGDPVERRLPDGSVVRPHVGVNPIALDPAGEWVYFGPMHGASMYRVRAADLRDPRLDDATLGARVERFGDKPICDGISVDAAGHVYVSDLGESAIGVIDPDGSYRLWVRDPRLSWPDAFSYGPEGKLWVVANQLHRSAPLHAGTDVSTPPYLVLRVQPLAPGVAGR